MSRRNSINIQRISESPKVRISPYKKRWISLAILALLDIERPNAIAVENKTPITVSDDMVL